MTERGIHPKLRRKPVFANLRLLAGALLFSLVTSGGLLPPVEAVAQTASLAATTTDGAINLTLTDTHGRTNWWFKINWGTCTAVSGTTVSNIRGYAAGSYSIKAYSDGSCQTQIAATTVSVPVLYPSANLTASVTDGAVSLTLSNGPSNWWFRISWGTCTAITGNTVNNIRGYAPASYNTRAFSDQGCHTKIAETTFTIPVPNYSSAALTATVANDWTVTLELSSGPSSWWFRINDGTCTAANGNRVSGIWGYRSGGHGVNAYSDGGCGNWIAEANFTISAAILSVTVDDSDDSVDLSLSGGPDTWWFRIASGTCTRASGTGVNGISGYQPGAYYVWAYLDSDCKYQIGNRSGFTIIDDNATYVLQVAIPTSGHVYLKPDPPYVGDWWYTIDDRNCTLSTSRIADAGVGSDFGSGTHVVKMYLQSQCGANSTPYFIAAMFNIP